MAKTIRIGNPYNSYSEDFSVAEDPLSRGGRFLNNTTTLLTRFRAAGGRAIAKSAGIGVFDDSAALMEGFGPDTQIEATLYRDAALNTSATHECELLFRATQSPNFVLQYEALFAFQGSIQAVRWFDDGGSQGFEFLTAVSGPLSLGREFITGDRIRARMQGSLLTLSCIDASNVVTVLGVYNNSVLATGLCGIGGFVRVGDGGNAEHFCFEDVFITEV